MTIAVLFPDGTSIIGATPHHALDKLTGRWNPPSVTGVRYAMARRAGFTDNPMWSDLDFLYELDKRGLLTVQIIDDDE